MHDTDFPERLEALKTASVGQLLVQCARLWNEQAIVRVHAKYGDRISLAHTRLFPHIDLEGTRSSVIAERIGISRQAVGKLITDLEEMRLVERIPDPSDGRAQLVKFSSTGKTSLVEGLGLLKEMEDELAASMGRETMQALHASLLTLREAMLR